MQRFADLDGKRVELSAPPKGATALVFYSTECPISNSYSPTLATIVQAFPAGRSNGSACASTPT